MTRQRAANWLATGVVAALPLVSWPGLGQPFSTPKRWLLLGAALLLGALAWRPARPPHEPRSRAAAFVRAAPVVWLASWVLPAVFAHTVSFDDLLLGIAGGLWGLALVASRPRARDLAMAAAAGGTAVAAIAIAQWAGYDPFSFLGWRPAIEGASVRMRVYATLGNPNVVAAYVAAAMPLTAAVLARAHGARERTGAAAALVLQGLAILATGSRAGALGVIAAGLAWSAVRRRRGLVIIAVAGVVAVAVIWLSQGRPLGDTIRGRVHVWRVIAAHALDHPWVGFGPGGIETHYGEWERQPAAKAGETHTGTADGERHQHADNVYLETLVERGVPGLAAVLFVLFVPLASSWRHLAGRRGGALIAGAVGAVAALAAVAAVDEPLARPAELMLLWAAIATCGVAPSED